MDPTPTPLQFDALDLPRAWSISIGKALFGLAAFSGLVLFLAIFWIKIAGLSIGMLLSQDGTVEKVLRAIYVLVIAPHMIAWFAEVVAVCFARLFGRPSSVCLTENEFWHPQLARPIRLADVSKLIIRRGFRTPDYAVTLMTIQPVRIKFMSPFNVLALMKRRDSSYRFTFMPMLWSKGGTLTQALSDAVQAWGGEIVRR